MSGWALLLAVGGCGEHRAPGANWPAGTLVVARTEALAGLLVRLQRLEGTRLARRAATLAEALPDCEWVEGREQEGPPADVWSRLTCRPADVCSTAYCRKLINRPRRYRLCWMPSLIASL